MELNVSLDATDEEVLCCNCQICMNGLPVAMELLNGH